MTGDPLHQEREKATIVLMEEPPREVPATPWVRSVPELGLASVLCNLGLSAGTITE